ncbi:hypothetical protein CesoFtcFv8_021585 [Champsocephalus esox]|uniref:Uncharacterized protein n=1 Tax=Champsocephalus esox TaxID=159716 RepID=A0AAN8B8X9_9TELE|nr:hypothetical protein CesoFtcFv8_021585 [Champsocephalus esox]
MFLSSPSDLQMLTAPPLTSAVGGEMPLLSPLLSSTPHRGVRKRRRITANPGGLHWTSTGSVQRDFWSPDPSPSRGVRSPPPSSSSLCEEERLQPHLRLTHLERGRRHRGIQVRRLFTTLDQISYDVGCFRNR